VRTGEADGFTLPELLVAITILGIITVAIGTMITTSFRTSAIVSAQLQGSRAPKTVSRYWVPDVEQAEEVFPGTSNGCGSGGREIAALTSTVFPSALEHPDQGDADYGTARVVAYRTAMNGAREQLVRWVCPEGAPATSLVVVADLDDQEPPQVTTSGARSTITVTVPDRSRTDGVYTFDVTAVSQLTTEASSP
jgi:prepilin-type N-terminal cleavage/methylation domain-containing protein